jgi:organic radical activating enzyme
MFGPTVQGEGPSMGQVALFVRLSNCNLNCGWCDTPYTWDWRRFDRDAQQRLVSADEVRDWVLGQPPAMVVVTGGEPLLQQRLLVDLVGAWARSGRRVEVETNGTIVARPELLDMATVFNVSTKLTNSGVPTHRRVRARALESFVAGGKAVFKFVVRDTNDLDEVGWLVDRFALSPVWVMPEGDTAAGVLGGLRLIADDAVARGWNLSARLHTLLWGDVRGR